MNRTSNISEIETLCREIMNSPYFRKQTPVELTQLRALLNKVDRLVNEAVPPLVSEVKQLRNQAKRHDAEIEALEANRQAVNGNAPS